MNRLASILKDHSLGSNPPVPLLAVCAQHCPSVKAAQGLPRCHSFQSANILCFHFQSKLPSCVLLADTLSAVSRVSKDMEMLILVDGPSLLYPKYQRDAHDREARLCLS